MQKEKQVNPQNKSWKLFLVAVVCALLAGAGTMAYLKILERQLVRKLTPPAKTMASVIVAKSDLAVGTRVDSTSMAIRQVPAEYVNSDVVTPATFDSVSGAILVKPLPHGKMLTEDYLDLNIPRDFSGTIKVGYRAVTIQVDEIKSISGMIRPGNVIDLYARLASSTFAEKSGSTGNQGGSKDLVIPVLEDVLVLATDQRAARPNEDEFRDYDPSRKRSTYDTLTLELTPKDAALLSIADARGSLIAALRNPQDTQGVLFSEISSDDLLTNSRQLLQEAASKEHNRALAGVHRDELGRLVTRDGVVLKDQSLQLNKDGLLVTKDGKILSGRDLVVAPDGSLRTKDGDSIDTGSLVEGKDGTLIDKNGKVVAGNGYQSLKGGFLMDKDGHVLTPDGHVLSGVTVDADGTVRSKDGTKLTAADLEIAGDGTVRTKGETLSGLHVNKDGQVVADDGYQVLKGGFLRDKDGHVLTPDGHVLSGVTVDADGTVRTKDGSELNAADVSVAADGSVLVKGKTVAGLAAGQVDPRVAAKGYKALKGGFLLDKDGHVLTPDGHVLSGVTVDADGTVRASDGAELKAADLEIASDGTVKVKGQTIPGLHSSQSLDPILAGEGTAVNPQQLVNVDGSGKVYTKDGKLIEGAYVDKDGILRNKDGSALTSGDIAGMTDLSRLTISQDSKPIAGVSATTDPAFASKILAEANAPPGGSLSRYEVEYILGGSGMGAARTLWLPIDDQKSVVAEQ